MKLFKHIFNIAFWTTVCLYVVVATLLHVPFVQQGIGSVVASAIADKLATKVTVGRVDLGLFNRIIIDDVNILDQNGKNMLQSARIAAKIDIVDLLSGRINVTSAQLFSPKLQLYQTTASAKPNFMFVLDSLASKDSTSKKPLDVCISSFIMRHGQIVFDRHDLPRTPGRFNINHLDLSEVNMYASLPTLTDDTLKVAMRRFSLTDHSGLDLRNLSFHLYADTKGAELKDFLMELPNSSLNIPALNATYKKDNGKIIPATVKFNGTIEKLLITPADMTFLIPSLRTFRSQLSCSSSFSGTSTGINVSSFKVESTSGELNIDVSGWLKRNGARTLWFADVKQLGLSAQTVEFLSENLKGEKAEVPTILKRMGDIKASGTASTTRDGSITAKGDIRTDVGNVALRFAMGKNHSFKGHVATDGVDLYRLTTNDRIGIAALDLELKGNLKQVHNTPLVSFQGAITKFSYDGYEFSNIDIDGNYSDNVIGGKVSIDDPNIKLDAEGKLSKEGQRRDIALNINISDICPKAIHLTDKWNDARFSTSINADFKASDISDSQGEVSIRNFSMTSPTDTCTINNIDINAGFANGIHTIRLDSDFGQIEVFGEFDYSTLGMSFANVVGQRLPTLPGLPHARHTPDNNFTLRADINSTSWMKPLLNIPLDIHTPLKVEANLNDIMKNLTMNAQLDEFAYNDNIYRWARITMASPLDTLHIDANVEKEMGNGDLMQLNASCAAADNRLKTSLRWNNGNTEKQTSGEINAMASFFSDMNNNKSATISIMPSHINIGNKQWNVVASNILYQPKNIDVNQFKIEHEQQHIIINGRASDNTCDSLRIDLQAVDVDYVLNLVNFHAVDFSGEASGQAYVVAPFGKFDAHANLTVEKFLFQDGRMGVLNARVDWNKEEKQIDIHAVADDGPTAQTYIDGYVSPSRNFIDLGFHADGTHIDFLHSFTKSFLSEVNGQAHGKLRLAGPLNNINLTGKVAVTGDAMVKPLNCRYHLKNDTVTLIPDEIKLDGVTLFDAYGNKGEVSGSLFHKHLTRLSYDIKVKAENLLAYDFRDFGSNIFYGTIFGTGDVAMRGRSGLFIMDIDITPQPNSVFTYNVSSPDALSSQEFIEWGNDAPIPSSGEILEQPSHLSLPSDMYLNFTVNCTPDATIRILMDERTGDYITLNGDGVIKATYYDKGSFNMFGTYTVDHGTYSLTIQNILKKNFTFNQGGTLVFGGNPFDAALNLQAVHTVNGVSLSDLNVGNSFSNNTTRVNCLMNIGGVARSPQVSFDIDMPTVSTDEKQLIRSVLNSEEEMNQQVVYLLGIGKFYPQTNNNASTQGGQYSQTSLAMQSLLSGTISGQINSILGSVIKSNNWNFGANISTGDEGWNNAEYEGLLSGRLLNNRLLINGQFGYRDNAATASTSFIGDFDIRYLLTPNGNFALKVYNETNDRYFTKSSLNTQGIGLIMKKDFNNFRDLFGAKKKKKKKKK
ncbi:MAG: translocation/assembly module TamB domain-containing protein [Prevotella sp.]